VFIHHAILEDIIYGDTSVLLKDFIDHYNALQSSPGMPIDGEYYKIGKVRPPAQAFAGPNIVPSIKGKTILLFIYLFMPHPLITDIICIIFRYRYSV
jgi:hypothetical protein